MVIVTIAVTAPANIAFQAIVVVFIVIVILKGEIWKLAVVTPFNMVKGEL